MMTSKHFCVKWTKFETNILSAFESLQNTEDLADVTLTCEGINIKAHKFILSACSPYFRTIFKENPCPHPIVILKDVAYVDLIAIVNFMYHGEVLINEEQLHSFLQTATILQVSGLINGVPQRKEKSSLKKVKSPAIESPECPLKKAKISTKPKTIVSEDNRQQSSCFSPYEIVEIEKIKTESEDLETAESLNKVSDNTDKEDENSECTKEKTDGVPPILGSILEAALEVRDKPSSILERSLTSQPISGRSPSSVPPVPEKPAFLQILPEQISKAIFIPRKPPESDSEKLGFRTSSESSSSPSTFDRPAEFLQQTIKIEGEPYDAIDPEEYGISFQRSIEVPHHSSQCGNCPHCGKIYSNQSALKYHVRLVHSDLTNMYCCHLCPESFDYREGYKKHMADVHSIRN